LLATTAYENEVTPLAGTLYLTAPVLLSIVIPAGGAGVVASAYHTGAVPSVLAVAL
jgi:hypothetical protein